MILIKLIFCFFFLLKNAAFFQQILQLLQNIWTTKLNCQAFVFLWRQNSRIARCHISGRHSTSFPKKKSIVTFLKKFGLIWFFFFQFFFWKDTCTKTCLKSKWSGSNSTVKKFKHLLWIQKNQWWSHELLQRTLIAEYFFFSCNHRISPNINVRG